MMRSSFERFLCVTGFLLLGASLVAGETIDQVKVVQVYQQLEVKKPLAITEVNDGSGRMVVVSQNGQIYIFSKSCDGQGATLFADLPVSRVDNEEGLLSLAFHPQFKTNHTLFVYYADKEPRRTILARLQIDVANPDRVEMASKQILLEVAQPFGNHKGGTILFDKKGLLYLSLGDGGAGGDPHGNGQNLGVLLAKILRLDVDHPSDGRMYGIPQDNPFVGKPGARPEIYAYGLRNPWRMSFDRKTFDLWAGDVGQNIWEEVDVIVKGGNYGWNVREGKHPYENKPPIPGTIDPVIDYKHPIGVSITGGYVYRGSAIPALRGVYLYADYGTGRLWGLRRKEDGTITNSELLQYHWNPTSFGEDAAGELYVTSYDGRIYKLIAP
jgi:glucose/arabinose dehydrogenase